MAISNLLVAMASHVSRFVARLFAVGPDAEAISERTRDRDDLFRFKVDFVGRRALPLVKGGARLAPSAKDDVERLIADWLGPAKARLKRGRTLYNLSVPRRVCGAGSFEAVTRQRSRLSIAPSDRTWPGRASDPVDGPQRVDWADRAVSDQKR